MPPKRRRRFQGIYYHSSPPKVFSMNGQMSNGHDRKRKREVDVKLSTIRIWMHEKDIGKLTRILWAGQGNRLRQQASTNSKVKRFLSAVPYVMNSIKDVHQAVIDNSLENLQSHLEPPVPPALVTCRDANGLNLIHKAAGLGHATILEYLIATWPDGVHETDITGKTPLHWAASAKNNMRCYTLLTQAGCDEEVLDYKMKTPTYYRHKPNEIERAFLTYVPDAPRVSPGIATDWEALSDDSGDGKKRDIKIPELNGFGRHSITESNENTSEAEVTEGLEQISEDNPPKNEESYVQEESAENANDPKAEEQSTNGNGEDQEASSEEVENTTAEINDPEEDNEEVKEEEQKSEKQSDIIINDCIAGTVTKDPVASQPGETDENEENNDDDIENETEVVASNEDPIDTSESDMEQNKISEEKKEKEIDENVEDGVIKIDSKTEAPLHNELDQNSDVELVEKNEDSSGEDYADKNESNKEHEDENEDETKSSDSDQEIKDENLLNIDQLSLPENDKLDSEDSEHTSEDGLKDRENQKTEEDENNNTKDAETSEEELQEVLSEHNELENKIDDDKEEGNENGIEINEFVKEIETNLETKIDEVTGYVKKAENELKTALSFDKSDAELIEQSDIEAEDDSKEVVIVNSENNSSKHDKAELNEKNYKDHFNMKNNNESESESENEDDEETNNNNNNSDDKENGKELTENNESTDNETELNDRNNNQDDEQMINENGDENVIEEDAAEEKVAEEEATEEEATEEEATAEKAAEEEEVAKEAVIEHGDNEKNLQSSIHENAERESAVTPSLAIEGFVAGASEDNTVQSQTAAIDHNEKELQLQQIVAAGDMEKLAQIVLNGDGEKLSNLEAAEPEVQAFLNNVPNYMNKIQRVHKAARNGSLLSLQQALDRRKFAISRDKISPNGATPLHVATLFGHSDILRYLAFRFPETTSATDFDGRTPLHYAAVINDNGHFYNVLLKLGANPKIEDKLGNTAEQYRQDDKLRDILNYRQLLMPFNAEELESQLLSDQGQIENHGFENNPLFKTEQGKYLADSLAEPLIKALTQIANKRPADPLLYLTNYLQSYVKTRNSNGKTITTTQAAVHSGTSVSHVARNEPPIEKQNGNAFMNGIDGDAAGNHMMENLEETEADDTKKMEERDEHGQSRLHFACARSNRKGALINLIEDSLIDITYRDELYRTARDVSLQANQLGNAKEIDRYVFSLAVVGDVKPFELLAVSGYDHIIDIYDDNDASIIDVAEQRGNTQIATFLRALRSMEELREELHQMIRDNRVERVKEIVDVPNGKWFIKAKNYYGRTALHIAILKESVEIVEHFVNICPESLKIGDNLERSPLHYAMGTTTIESISRILIQNGAKRTCKDLKGRQPSYYFMNKADILRLQEEEDENR